MAEAEYDDDPYDEHHGFDERGRLVALGNEEQEGRHSENGSSACEGVHAGLIG